MNIFDVEPPPTTGCIRCGNFNKKQKDEDKSFCNPCIKWINEELDEDPRYSNV